MLIAAVLGVVACGSPTPPHQGSSIPTDVLVHSGPRIPNGAIYSAGDLTTLKALVDAGNSIASQQLGAQPGTHQCMAPYSYGQDACWPAVQSSAGKAYIALALQAGFCETADPPEILASGFKLELTVVVHKQAGCHIAGVMTLPTASLVAFSTSALTSGLYAVDYVFQSDSDTYRSAATYLSIPSPTAGDQSAMEAAAVDALTRTIGTSDGGLFSESRVDGSTLQSLCGETTNSPEFLVTYLSVSTRQMQVVLATSPTHKCTATPV